MVIDIHVPNIGEDALEVTEILIKIGDNININQPLAIIEGDKSSMEIPSPYSGLVTKIYINIGEKVHTGSLILSVDVKNEPKNLQSLHKEKDISLDSAINQQNNLNNTITKNNNNSHYDDTKKTTSLLSTPTENPIMYATPVIRHMARKFRINLSQIKGSGRKGRILKEDLQNYLNNIKNNIHNHYPSQSSKKENKSFDLTQKKSTINTNNTTNYISTIQLTKIQQSSGRNLQKNWIEIPHVTQFDIIDITDLELFRKQQNLEIQNKKTDYKITILAFVIKAVSKVLKELPQFNSSLSRNGDKLILKKNINIGIAVNTKQGLLVPVLHNTNKKNIMTLAQELSEIAKKARIENQLIPSDMQGGTFTISNLGNIGGMFFTPIINAPEVAILGVSKSMIYPIWTGKKFLPKLVLPISLSYDHRVIDGVDGSKFIRHINKILSDIRLLSM
ncbi:dihydrolipoyllysine-residue acetyltransferase component of pyruvate dehydrogenase complex [Candidatus Blochmanniella vafra str. BVAF]|uniref:Dihydrolipoamide acetyltransferase component of pyruvate dehydrogenase complex n=1 Tax=Blochmanniella vafra (strain BVAF) TaxID=859654 RepID=E8Q5R3_BLOVB|nr:2-oxo acid dehydrogenase subunit E2 [Candidatus Blochmannia vafer]ADV33560.1 dihydrolipoyllysine-residue acetyltransferase component of pyruvate dehydrogenase complex [Candidatus Blochmannia vafer str. BVAF]